MVTRCPTEFERIRKQLRKFETGMSVDLQQRACEFLELLESTWDSSRAGILDRMPVSEVNSNGRDVGDASIDEVPPGASGGGSARPSGSPAVGGGPVGGGPPKDLLDLDDLLWGDSGGAPVAPQAPAVAPSGGGGGMDLLDMLGGSPAPAAQPAAASPGGGAGPADLGLMDIFGASPAPAAPAAGTRQEFPPMVGFEKGPLKVVFFCVREADGSATVNCKFFNAGSAALNEFVFEAAVPKYLRLTLQPASASVLPPGSDNVTQSLNLVNTTGGEKGIMMKLRITYTENGIPVTELSQASNFPAGL